MRIALFGKSFSRATKMDVERIFEQLRVRDFEVICETNFAQYLCKEFGYCQPFEDYFDRTSLNEFKPDMLISIGGDGTFLDAVSFIKDTNLPILGINVGRLGFLANVALEELEGSLDSILLGEYVTEERDVLALQVNDTVLPIYDFALNEITIAKSETTSLLTIHAWVDDTYLTSYWSDGLIISTPTGSTAYSLSGGGPIVTPDCKTFTLTPICPHNLNLRSLVVNNGVTIKLEIESRSNDFILSLDSRYCKLSEDSKLTITKGDFTIKTIKLNSHNYYRTLRNKMLWGEDRRNQ